jgi:hypothetical protein
MIRVSESGSTDRRGSVLALLLPVLEVPGSDLDSEADYSEDSSGFPHACPAFAVTVQ